jgi:hypothetical protein
MKYLLTIVIVIGSVIYASAQCAMCKATLENNISNGHIGIAAGINFGILYLFVSPYLFIIIVAYFWYRTSRKNAAKSIDGNWAG